MSREPVQSAIHRAAQSETQGRAVVLACSGGGDSVTLARVATPILQSRGCRPVIAHLDHGLRLRGGLGDARFVADVALDLGIPFVRRRQRPDRRLTAQVGLQAAAREVRLGFLAGLADRLGGASVWLAHHEDDQLETLWMRQRTARPTGMPARRDPFVRPLLGLPHAQLRALCAERGWTWRQDPSNRDPRFDRTRARAAVAQLTGPERRALLAEGSRWSRRFDERQTRARAIVPTLLRPRSDGLLDLDRAALRSLDDDALHAIRLLLPPHLPGARPPSRAALTQLLRLVRGAPDGITRRIDLGAGWSARVEPARIALRRAPEGVLLPVPRIAADVQPHRARRLLARWPLLAGRRFALVDADAAGPLRLGRAGSGRRFQPHGMGGTRLVRDVLAEAGVPEPARGAWPTVETAAGDVLWLAGIRASATAHLRVDSTRVTLLYTGAPLTQAPPQRLDS